MADIEINMPQMAVVGLSENWLLRHCGNEHWAELCKSISARSSDLVDGGGNRLYASFLAVRVRAAPCLGRFRENDVLVDSRRLARFGTSIYTSVAELAGPRGAVQVEMVSKFVAREVRGHNRLRSASLRPASRACAPELDVEPELLEAYRRVKAGASHELGGVPPVAAPAFDFESTSGAYAPNPYVEYNGAGLLYFASYPSICDGLERRCLHTVRPAQNDWALEASTVARDIFYLGNLDLGQELVARVRLRELAGPAGAARRTLIHTTLLEANAERRLAEVFTLKESL